MMTNRSQAPEIRDLQKINLLQPTFLTSNSGIEVCWIQELSNPIFHLQIELGGGKLRQDKLLQSAFSTDLLLSGTRNFNQKQIADAIDLLGVYLNFEAGKSNTILNVYGLNERFNDVLPWIHEVLILAEFPNEPFERHRFAAEQKFHIDQEKTSYLARRLFNQALFQNHPYGHFAELADFQKITRDDCVDFYNKHLRSKINKVHLVGEIEQRQIDVLLQFLDDFKHPDILTSPRPSVFPAEEVYVEKEDAVQSTIRIGNLCLSPRDADYQKFDILETILGGYFGSRLMQNLREKNGFTYGVGSGIANFDDVSYFFIATDVGKQHKDAALASIKEEIERLRNEPLEKEELDSAKAYIQGQILKNTDGALSQLGIIQFAQRFDLPFDYVNQFLQTLSDIGASDIQEIARKHLDWSKMTKVAVG